MFSLSGLIILTLCHSCLTPYSPFGFSRILRCREAGVPITNYGIIITYTLGVLDRALSPFPAYCNS
jgi:hypothetical protein